MATARETFGRKDVRLFARLLVWSREGLHRAIEQSKASAAVKEKMRRELQVLSTQLFEIVDEIERWAREVE